MVEYHLDPNLEEMAKSIDGKSDKFIRVVIQFPKRKEPKAFEFPGDEEFLVDKLTDLVRKGKGRVVTQAIGTYSDEASQ